MRQSTTDHARILVAGPLPRQWADIRNQFTGAERERFDREVVFLDKDKARTHRPSVRGQGRILLVQPCWCRHGITAGDVPRRLVQGRGMSAMVRAIREELSK